MGDCVANYPLVLLETQHILAECVTLVVFESWEIGHMDWVMHHNMMTAVAEGAGGGARGEVEPSPRWRVPLPLTSSALVLLLSETL